MNAETRRLFRAITKPPCLRAREIDGVLLTKYPKARGTLRGSVKARNNLRVSAFICGSRLFNCGSLLFKLSPSSQCPA
jgi:hypothetical protein